MVMGNSKNLHALISQLYSNSEMYMFYSKLFNVVPLCVCVPNRKTALPLKNENLFVQVGYHQIVYNSRISYWF